MRQRVYIWWMQIKSSGVAIGAHPPEPGTLSDPQAWFGQRLRSAARATTQHNKQQTNARTSNLFLRPAAAIERCPVRARFINPLSMHVHNASCGTLTWKDTHTAHCAHKTRDLIRSCQRKGARPNRNLNYLTIARYRKNDCLHENELSLSDQCDTKRVGQTVMLRARV